MDAGIILGVFVVVYCLLVGWLVGLSVSLITPKNNEWSLIESLHSWVKAYSQFIKSELRILLKT